MLIVHSNHVLSQVFFLLDLVGTAATSYLYFTFRSCSNVLPAIKHLVHVAVSFRTIIKMANNMQTQCVIYNHP